MMIRLISSIHEILVWILVQTLRRSKYVWITGAMGLRFAAFLIIGPLEAESFIHNFLAVSLYALAAFISYYIPLRIYEWFDEQLKGMDRRFNEPAGKSFYHDNITHACRLFCRSVTATFMQLLSLYMGSSKEYPDDLVCWVFSLWAGSVVLISYGTMTEDDYGVAVALIDVVLNQLNIGSNFRMVWVAVLLVITQASRIIIIPIIINFNIWYGDPPCPRVWGPELPISNPSCTTNRPRDQTHESTSEAPHVQSPTPQSSPPAEQTHESPPATNLKPPQSTTPHLSPPAVTTSEPPKSPTPHSSPPAEQTHESTSEAPHVQSPTPHSSPPAEQTHESPPATTLKPPQSTTPHSSPPAETTSEAPKSPTPHSSPPADQTHESPPATTLNHHNLQLHIVSCGLIN